MIPLFIFFFGLAIGSFLNVVISRLDGQRSFWQGRSACPNCGKGIYWYDNIPLISFILLSGKCRQCHKKISFQYPIVELVTALIFLWQYFLFGLSFRFFAFVILSSFLVVIFVYDLKKFLILDRVSIPAMFLALIFNLALGVSLFDMFLGALIGGGFFAAQFFISRGRWVGDGDIRLGILMGLILGWKFLLVALFMAYLAGALMGIILIALNKKKMSSEIPFGPFLTASTFVVMTHGKQILSWYLGLFYF
ncbi:prepilin peptidase [Candidatus Falkowbacteria bacterium]|nr:prepilin peptidase [Candidatus Falkowbacteria bacterium]